MDLKALGKQLLGDKLGGGGGAGGLGGVMDGLSKLTGGGEGQLDLGEIVGKLKQGGLGEQVDSWLGDGDNAEVSGEQVKSALGEDKVAEVASSMGVDTATAADKIKDVLPTLLDKSSSGGSLMDKFGGANSAVDMAKNLFK